MTGPELARCLETLGWSRYTLAERIGLSEPTVRRMEAGTRPIDPLLETRLLRAARAVGRLFPPRPSTRAK